MNKTNDIVQFIKEKDYVMINDHLGQGSFGKTVVLKDASIGELFVCKKFQPYYKEDAEKFYELFKREIAIMYKLNHENIVRIYNYYLYNEFKTGYIIMEYIRGDNIDSYFKEHILTLDVNDIFLQLIKAFECLEKNGVCHRDIRFANILVDEDDTVKLIDFGLGKIYTSKTISQDSLTKEIDRKGMEVVPNELSHGEYTIKTDMFCIAELYNRLIKKYEIKDFKYSSILGKMMNVDPDKRYESFEKILATINNKEFQLLAITVEDKQIYGNFTESLKRSIDCYTESFKMEENISNILVNLQTVINDNCFEDSIINNADLISVFVKCGYKYYSRAYIETNDVVKFYHWISNKDSRYQKIVLSNLKAKLKTIKIEYKDEDLPF